MEPTNHSHPIPIMLCKVTLKNSVCDITSHNYTCDMTHLYVWHVSLYLCGSVTWLIYMCDMTHLYVWHDSSIRVTWLIDMCDKSRYICITRLVTHIYLVTHLYVWHVSLYLFSETCHTYVSRYICVVEKAWVLQMVLHKVTLKNSVCDVTYFHDSSITLVCRKGPGCYKWFYTK